ncbi:MAG: hypothetical protein HYZ34_06970 [Ignavibacteriae bacterium]|nr:hypothetical protein [Ignavibacteriota bacterium]
MAFTGDENHAISLNDAARLTYNFRESRVIPDIKGGYFGRRAIEEVLGQDGCVGIRIYYGTKDDGSPSFVVVGVDAIEDDIIDGNAAIMDENLPCPPRCGKANVLNS